MSKYFTLEGLRRRYKILWQKMFFSLILKQLCLLVIMPVGVPTFCLYKLVIVFPICSSWAFKLLWQYGLTLLAFCFSPCFTKFWLGNVMHMYFLNLFISQLQQEKLALIFLYLYLFYWHLLCRLSLIVSHFSCCTTEWGRLWSLFCTEWLQRGWDICNEYYSKTEWIPNWCYPVLSS